MERWNKSYDLIIKYFSFLRRYHYEKHIFWFLFSFSQLLVLHFEAEWAEECKQMNEVFTELSKEFTRSIFARVSIHCTSQYAIFVLCVNFIFSG